MENRIKKSISLVALIAVNLVPIIGLIFLGWSPLRLLFYFWAECGVIAFFTILRLIIEPIDEEVELDLPILQGEAMAFVSKKWQRPALIFVFTVYSLLSLIISALLYVLFLGFPAILINSDQLGAALFQLLYSSVPLLIVHGIIFAANFLAGEDKKIGVKLQINQSLNRILFILTIIFLVGIVLKVIGLSSPYFIIVVVIKALLDLGLFLQGQGYAE
jgi:hypothetical protein